MIEDWFPLLAGDVDLGVVVLDPAGRIAFCNASAEELLALWNGRQDKVDVLWRGLARDLQERAGKTCDALPDGATWELGCDRLSLRVRVRRRRDGDGILLLLRDLRLLEELRRNLRLATCYEVLRRLHAVAAHDIRAPLNAVSLNLTLIREDLETGGSDDSRRRAEVTLNEIARIDRMLHDMLEKDFGADEGDTDFDANVLVRNLCELVRQLCREHGIEIEMHLPARPSLVHGRRDRLKQVLLNLVLNAVDAMEGGGVLTLRVERLAERVRIDVEDTGPGMNEEQMKRLFDMHYTTKPDGRGVGLYVVRTTVQEHGGSVTARNKADDGNGGHGAVFEVNLPLVASPVQREREDEA